MRLFNVVCNSGGLSLEIRSNKGLIAVDDYASSPDELFTSVILETNGRRYRTKADCLGLVMSTGDLQA